jgi:hypothetical protein
MLLAVILFKVISVSVSYLETYRLKTIIIIIIIIIIILLGFHVLELVACYVLLPAFRGQINFTCRFAWV